MVESLTSLREVLDPHLAREEQEMMPVVSKTLTHEQWEEFNQEHFIKPKSKTELGLEGHWLIDSIDRRGYEVVVGNVPAILRLVVRPLRSPAEAPLAAILSRDVIGLVLELAKFGRVDAAEGPLGVGWCEMHGPRGDVDTAARHDTPDAQTLAAVHTPVVRENAVGRHGLEGIEHARACTRACAVESRET